MRTPEGEKSLTDLDTAAVASPTQSGGPGGLSNAFGSISPILFNHSCGGSHTESHGSVSSRLQRRSPGLIGTPDDVRDLDEVRQFSDTPEDVRAALNGSPQTAVHRTSP